MAQAQDQRMKDKERLERLKALEQEETQYGVWRLSGEKTEQDIIILKERRIRKMARAINKV